MKPYLILMRPANIVTAIADILLGFAVAMFVLGKADGFAWWEFARHSHGLWHLILATVGLYGGGVVLNDVFDYELDKKERPERPLPSGQVSVTAAAVFGAALLVFGVAAASFVSVESGIIAFAVGALAVIYDYWGKHQDFLGPINMGMCRGGNLLLGVGVVAGAVASYWFLAFVPILFIATITMISRGEVHGGSPVALRAAVVMYLLVIGFIASLGFMSGFQLYSAMPFLLLFAYFVFPALFKALQNPSQGPLIGKAVKAGVISLIIMDAAIAAGFCGWPYGLLVLALLPISILLAKVFAVT
ncbi:UbiA-like protein EboC [Flammeovirgaceae bacterium SG7u.111]|nr:UbiA-like protein EboC [Flammeovirgaceae bacterium SG7u.132]WPO36851.1 UbiA-like protein EboC [Flammeovirgaceae bacterium SG7u.111]